jgi:dGTPase
VVSDYRTDSEHDCDRILYSSAYRRLAGITQVVAVNELQLFHTRLTHTQKVAQLSRRLAFDITRNPDNGPVLDAIDGIDESAAEAAALAHDLGHPPFGHIAEEVLCDLCDAAGADGFEGNAQSFRIVTELARRASDEPGLDLHTTTLRGILKYPWLRGPDPGNGGTKEEKLHHRKWGAYLSEEEQFEAVLAPGQGHNKSAEAAIMDWCDDISYALHDLEDFYRAGLIPLDRIAHFDDHNTEVTTFQGRADRELADDPKYEPDEGARALHRLRGYLPGTPYSGSHEDRQGLHTMTSQFISAFFKATTVHETRPWIRFQTGADHEVKLLKQLTWQYVVNGPGLATLQEGQRRVVREVFEALSRWLPREWGRGTTHRLPTRLVSLHRNLRADPAAMDTLSTDDARCARVVADYICSLTEEQLVDLHGRLTGHTVSSVQDGWIRW